LTDFIATACWAWAPAGPRSTPFQRPSVDPEGARIEDAEGLTAEVLRRYLERLPEIVGPLLRRPDLFRPLSLRSGRLVACELLGVPHDLPGWEDWLTDLEHVQTSSPAVCEALVSSVPSFTVVGSECVEALREGDVRVVDAGSPTGPTEAWYPAPFLDARAFLPIVAVAHRTWWCWDLDEERPVLLATGKEPSYFSPATSSATRTASSVPSSICWGRYPIDEPTRPRRTSLMRRWTERGGPARSTRRGGCSRWSSRGRPDESPSCEQ